MGCERSFGTMPKTKEMEGYFASLVGGKLVHCGFYSVGVKTLSQIFINRKKTEGHKC